MRRDSPNPPATLLSGLNSQPFLGSLRSYLSDRPACQRRRKISELDEVTWVSVAEYRLDSVVGPDRPLAVNSSTENKRDVNGV